MPNIVERNDEEVVDEVAELDPQELEAIRGLHPSSRWMIIDESNGPITCSRSNPMARCNNCRNEVTDQNAQDFRWVTSNNTGRGELICNTCYASCYHECIHCGDWASYQEQIEVNTAGGMAWLCTIHHEDHTWSCRGCGGVHYFEDERPRTRQCDGCRRRLRPPNEISLRSYDPDESLTENAGEGKIVKSIRAFGIELEAQFHDPRKAIKASHELDERVGVGTDGSITGGNGLEFRLPPVAGRIGEDMVTGSCAILNKNGFTVDNSCGFHVHIDMHDIDDMNETQQLTSIKNLWAFYLCFEDVIQSFLPASRRMNGYCRSLKTDYHIDEILRAKNMNVIERIWYRVVSENQVASAKDQHSHESRYRGINFHSLLSARHLEIRYHSGTLRTRKILEWVNLHCKIADVMLRCSPLNRSYFNRYTDMPLPEKTKVFMKDIGLGGESQEYFKARQAMFYVAPKFEKTVAFDEATKELTEEKEPDTMPSNGRNSNYPY